MKKIALAAALSLAATAAVAGGLSEPIIEPEVIEQSTTGSAAGILVPIFLLLAVAAAAS